MSTGDKIQAVATGVSALAFLGLIFSLWSLRRATFASVYQGITGEMQDLDRLFVERPELRPHFYGNKPLPDDENARERLLAIAELIVDFADNFVAQCPTLPSRYERGYRDYFKDLYRSSPAIQRFWEDCGRWYSPDLRRLFAAAAREHSTAAPAPSTAAPLPPDGVPA